MCWSSAAAIHVPQQQCYCLETLKMCTHERNDRFACCAGCEQYLMTPIPLAMTTPSSQTASGSHMTEANLEAAAVQASGQHTTSTAPLGGDTSAELPSGTAREEANPSRAESAGNPSSAVADTTVGTTLPCTAYVCQGGGRVLWNVPFTLLLFRQHDLHNSCLVSKNLSHSCRTLASCMISTITQHAYATITTLAYA